MAIEDDLEGPRVPGGNQLHQILVGQRDVAPAGAPKHRAQPLTYGARRTVPTRLSRIVSISDAYALAAILDHPARSWLGATEPLPSTRSCPHGAPGGTERSPSGGLGSPAACGAIARCAANIPTFLLESAQHPLMEGDDAAGSNRCAGRAPTPAMRRAASKCIRA